MNVELIANKFIKKEKFPTLIAKGVLLEKLTKEC